MLLALSRGSSRSRQLLKSSINAHAQEPAATFPLFQEIPLDSVLGSADCLRQQRNLGLFPAGAAARGGQPEARLCSAYVFRLFPPAAWDCRYKRHFPVFDAMDRDRSLARNRVRLAQ